MLHILYMAAGLSGLWDNLKNDWLGPIFLAAVAAFSIMFIKDRAWMKLLGFVGIAAIVGVLVYNADDLVGSKGNLKDLAQKKSTEINSIEASAAPNALGSGINIGIK